MEDVHIRQASSDDVPMIVEIYNQGVDGGISTFDDYYVSPNRYLAYFGPNKSRSSLLVAIHQHRVVGWASIDPISERHAYRFTSLGSVYVHKDFRAQGVGRLLKLSKLDNALRLGYHSMICEVLSNNPISIALNLSLGFHIVGEIQEAGFRHEQWIGLVVMQRFLTPS